MVWICLFFLFVLLYYLGEHVPFSPPIHPPVRESTYIPLVTSIVPSFDYSPVCPVSIEST
ncbi:hypothetical protein BO94DRAFT_138173 [Aspergillus sclerotioniger CBS 115572]|uniref:Uncharacterized protein n=1 Tax=Aspergillus sclerotioniger CBS 115572 TaxID=1450535 RepID=A0A317XBY3_9EURO|nr:hypothetical protein BO94DRAFT_138173 [Aspergillus sclerotioniger CBS 115572]PWY95845.1 hypothetical protein BO94DRAFT_138173 [Aspergillus sclerotioniger CBS 115572]